MPATTFHTYSPVDRCLLSGPRRAFSGAATTFRGTHERGSAIGYDLVFWKQVSEQDVVPSTVYRSLINGRSVDGLATLPIASILSELVAALPGSVRESNARGLEWIDWVNDDDQSSLQIWWSDAHVYVDCRGASYEVINRIIGLLAEFGCPLYDPQVDKRFESST